MPENSIPGISGVTPARVRVAAHPLHQVGAVQRGGDDVDEDVVGPRYGAGTSSMVSTSGPP